MTFGEKLKAIRKEKGYSQEEMAGLLDVSRQAVSKWESDRGIPEIDKLLQISNMTGKTGLHAFVTSPITECVNLFL